MEKLYNNKLLLYIFLLFLLIRFIFIFNFPPFIDESNYIQAGKISLSQESFRFFATDYWGKEALPIWFFGFGGNLTEDPIIGARLLVLFVSSISFFYLFFLTKKILSIQAAFVATFLYAICPGFIIFNSLAQQDSLLLALNIIILYYLFEFKESFRVKDSIIIGILISTLVWIKATSVIILALTSFTFVFFFLTHEKFNLRKIYLLIIPFITLILSIIILTKTTDLSLILEQTSKYSSLKDSNLSLISLWLKNFLFVTLTLMIYLSPLVFFSFIFSLNKLKKRNFFILSLWTIVPLIFFILASNEIKARYFIYSLGAFLPIISYSIYNLIKQRKKYYISALGVLLFLETILLIFNPYLFFSIFPKNSLVEAERDYAYSWPSGYGVKEALNYFKDIRPDKPVFLILHDHPSNLPSSYIMSYYFNREFENTKLIIASFESKENVGSLKNNIKNESGYFISNSIFVPKALKPNLTLIKKFEKQGSEDFTGVYSLKF
ncbi:glycosyltransferase family 39 protein [Candidatus Daviesbacteria bacterium]|nr:glycosyltransferase family 39 protein [Candidatus Daviesbacteria bacterium]